MNTTCLVPAVILVVLAHLVHTRALNDTISYEKEISRKFSVEGREYDVFMISLRWSDAKRACNGYGKKLLSLETSFEDSAVRDLLEHSKDYDFWTSGTSIGTPGQFYWAESGLALGHYSSWTPGEPNDEEVACIQLWGSHEHSWDDSPCDNLRPFICEDN